MNWEGFVGFYHADNLDETRKFYCDILNLEMYKDQGACHIYEVTRGSYIGFCTHFPKGDPEDNIITLLTNNVDEMYEYIKENSDVTVQAPPELNEKFNIYHFFIKDPNGYKVEIQKFMD